MSTQNVASEAMGVPAKMKELPEEGDVDAGDTANKRPHGRHLRSPSFGQSWKQRCKGTPGAPPLGSNT